METGSTPSQSVLGALSAQLHRHGITKGRARFRDPAFFVCGPQYKEGKDDDERNRTATRSDPEIKQ